MPHIFVTGFSGMVPKKFFVEIYVFQNIQFFALCNNDVFSIGR